MSFQISLLEINSPNLSEPSAIITGFDTILSKTNQVLQTGIYRLIKL